MSELPLHITLSDFFLSIIFIGIIFFAAWIVRIGYAQNPCYRFFLSGLVVKIFGAISVCLVYMYYYPSGGDTLHYFYSSKVVGSLIFNHPSSLFRIVFLNDISVETLAQFNSHTGWPDFTNDYFSFFLVRVVTPLSLISFGNFIACSILLAALSYIGIWKLYLVFCRQFPSLVNQMAIAILFMPSVVFFGSGILKDTVTFSSLGWFVYGLHSILGKRYSARYFLIIIISAYFLLSIKPYILYAVLIASIVWFAANYLKSESLAIMRYVYAPALLIVFSLTSVLAILSLGSNKGRFSISEMQKEMTIRRNSYDPSPPGSKFQIQPIGNSFPSLVANAPSLICATLFRPFIWETGGNAMMIFLALENLFMVAFFALLLYKSRIIFLPRKIFSNPFIIFSVCLVLIFSFMVGISTDNFGTLARFRIPIVPFFVAACFILNKMDDTLAVGPILKTHS